MTQIHLWPRAIAAWGLTLLLASVSSADEWRLRLIDNKGIDDPNNIGIARMTSFGEFLYLTTWNTESGGKLYRSRDGESWERIGEPGMNGNAKNFCLTSLAWLAGQLYVGVWNQSEGGSMFRGHADAPNPVDIKWETITSDAFGNRRNWGFTHIREFKGNLYAGCFNLTQGSEVWRSDSGDPGSWTMVIPKGWGSPANSDTTMMIDDGKHLYVGTESARKIDEVGMQLWRTDGELAPPYDQWELVNTEGFGNPRNHNICGLAILKGKIYAGTWNRTQGLEVWRATIAEKAPFTDWEKVNENGFGDKENIYTCTMVTLADTVFVGSIGTFKTVPELFTLPKTKLVNAHGGTLAKSTDGTTWELVDIPGFMDDPQIGIQWIATFQGKLYIGSQTFGRPMELWVYEPVN